jgi:hypothetical protein
MHHSQNIQSEISRDIRNVVQFPSFNCPPRILQSSTHDAKPYTSNHTGYTSSRGPRCCIRAPDGKPALGAGVAQPITQAMTALEGKGRADRCRCRRGKRCLHLGHRCPSCSRDLNGHAVASAAAREARHACIVVLRAIFEGRCTRCGIAERGRYNGEREEGVAYVGRRRRGPASRRHSCARRSSRLHHRQSHEKLIYRRLESTYVVGQQAAL